MCVKIKKLIFGEELSKTRDEAEPQSCLNEHWVPIPTLPGGILQSGVRGFQSPGSKVQWIDAVISPICSCFPVSRLLEVLFCTLPLGLAL